MPRSDSEAKIKNPGIPGLQGSIVSWIVPSGAAAGGRSSRLDWTAASPCSTSRLGGFAFRRRRILKPRRRAVLFFLGTLYGVDRKPNVLGLVSAWFKPLRWAARRREMARWAWVPSCDRRPFIKTANSFGRTLSSSSELYFTVNHVHVQ